MPDKSPSAGNLSRRRLILTGIAVIAVLGLPAVLFWPRGLADKSQDKLYNQAVADIKAKRLRRAVSKLSDILMADPANKKAPQAMRAVTAALVSEAKKDIAAKNYDQANEDLDLIARTDPNNPNLPRLRRRIPPSKVAPGTGTNPADSQPGGNSDGGNAPSEPNQAPADLKPISDSSVPIDLLPKSMPDYLISQTGWQKAPIQAGSTYKPKLAPLKDDIGGVILTIAKYDTGEEAAARVSKERELYPKQPKIMTINGHEAYFGIYNESMPDKFPPMAALLWTRGRWYFGLETQPKRFIDTDYKEQIIVNVAREFGY